VTPAGGVRPWGVVVARDAVATIRVCVLHHLGLGLERVLVLDNGSSDGTSRVLRRLQRRVPLTVMCDPGPFDQEELTAGLVDEARRSGASWIVPIDADELWWSRRPLRELLGDAPADVLRCRHVNFVQGRGVRRASPRALLTMTHRAVPRGDYASRTRLVTEGRIALVERVPPAKHVYRALDGLRITAGSHGFTGVPATVADCPDLECLHAPLIAREALAARVEHGRRVIEASDDPGSGWHVRRIAALHQAEGDAALEREWAANAQRDGALDVGGERHAVIADTRLADAARPWVRSRPAQALARLARRSY
jgi:hypothetical protein